MSNQIPRDGPKTNELLSLNKVVSLNVYTETRDDRPVKKIGFHDEEDCKKAADRLCDRACAVDLMHSASLRGQTVYGNVIQG